MSTTIYRIETPEGAGMYCSRVSNITNEMQDMFKHPMPDEDDLLVFALKDKSENGSYILWSKLEHYYFGFSSVEQLRRWIYQDEWLRILHDDGLVITVIESNDVLLGHTQAMFSGRVSEQQHSILEFFNLS